MRRPASGRRMTGPAVTEVARAREPGGLAGRRGVVAADVAARAGDRLEHDLALAVALLDVGSGHEHDLAGCDLLEGDRKRLAGDGGDLGRHDGAQTLAQLVEVRVDLPPPL